MIGVYDNGGAIIGNVFDIILEVEREIHEDIDMCFVNKQNLLKDLKEIQKMDSTAIVYICYDTAIENYDFTWWSKGDRV